MLLKDHRRDRQKYFSKSGVQSVQVPGMESADQRDLIWHSAKKQSDGTYKVTVELSKHQNHKGTYNIHHFILRQTETRYIYGRNYI